MRKPSKISVKIKPVVESVIPEQNRRQHYDALVVGAGPAGSMAAYTMAKAGLDVAFFERAMPGEKTAGGAAIYALPTHELLPDFWKHAPIERFLTDQRYMVLTGDSGLSISFKSEKYAQAPYNRISIHRAKFDKWLAEQAVTAGATLYANHKVDELIKTEGKISGLRIGKPLNREFYADVIVLAEGVNALLAERAGLVPRIKADNVALYVKETMALPAKTIEERFNLPPGQGAAIGMLGYTTADYMGTAALYTNKESLGLNVGTLVSNFTAGNFNPHDLIMRIKTHPLLAPLFVGTQTIEYCAQMIPEGGYHAIPPLVHPGCLIVGDAAGLVNGIQGLNLAMLSGQMAGKTIIAAKHANDFSQRRLSLYKDLLDDSYIMQDLRANRHLPHFYATHPWMPAADIAVANEIAYHAGMVYPMPKRAKRLFMLRKAVSLQPFWKLAADFFQTLWVMK